VQVLLRLSLGFASRPASFLEINPYTLVRPLWTFPNSFIVPAPPPPCLSLFSPLFFLSEAVGLYMRNVGTNHWSSSRDVPVLFCLQTGLFSAPPINFSFCFLVLSRYVLRHPSLPLSIFLVRSRFRCLVPGPVTNFCIFPCFSFFETIFPVSPCPYHLFRSHFPSCPPHVTRCVVFFFPSQLSFLPRSPPRQDFFPPEFY